jgi:hypothetical protein
MGLVGIASAGVVIVLELEGSVFVVLRWQEVEEEKENASKALLIPTHF